MRKVPIGPSCPTIPFDFDYCLRSNLSSSNVAAETNTAGSAAGPVSEVNVVSTALAGPSTAPRATPQLPEGVSPLEGEASASIVRSEQDELEGGCKGLANLDDAEGELNEPSDDENDNELDEDELEDLDDDEFVAYTELHGLEPGVRRLIRLDDRDLLVSTRFQFQHFPSMDSSITSHGKLKCAFCPKLCRKGGALASHTKFCQKGRVGGATEVARRRSFTGRVVRLHPSDRAVQPPATVHLPCQPREELEVEVAVDPPVREVIEIKDSRERLPTSSHAAPVTRWWAGAIPEWNPYVGSGVPIGRSLCEDDQQPGYCLTAIDGVIHDSLAPWHPFTTRADLIFCELARNASLDREEISAFLDLIQRCQGEGSNRAPSQDRLPRLVKCFNWNESFLFVHQTERWVTRKLKGACVRNSNDGAQAKEEQSDL
ncbi:hypothetical protein DFP72DRAFT_841975 [Ephemerocybe angulata]|uniref:Uncharacterized protein n=1 Tax=Ephemerocybe angulata TaxID=980116 RepID=A0A8H6MF75_9AGAR|nr:hypothetical protein DFP72DRAFT_841975 [Tulosesus angulatus]